MTPSGVTVGATEPQDTADAVRRRWVHTVEVDDTEVAALSGTGDLSWLTAEHELDGWGTAVRVAAGSGADRFRRAADLLARHAAACTVTGDAPAGVTPPVAFCSFTFDHASDRSVVVVPEVTLYRRGGRAWLIVVADHPVAEADLRPPQTYPRPDDPGRVRYAGTTAKEIAWLDAVDRAVRRLHAGEAEKVVLARDRVVYRDAAFDPAHLLTRLRTSFPTCYVFHVAGLVGASPELLVRRRGNQVASLVLAGTAPRGAGDAEDARIGDQLLASDKDLAEHRPAVASVRRVLEPLAARLDVDPQPSLLRLRNVQHLATNVTATLTQPVHVLDLAGRLHPTAAVGGTPRDVALAMITELETIDRDRYAGPVGWVDGGADGEFAIALRCAQLQGNRARLFAGAGIVAGSLPESELEETRLKLRAMQSAFEEGG